MIQQKLQTAPATRYLDLEPSKNPCRIQQKKEKSKLFLLIFGAAYGIITANRVGNSAKNTERNILDSDRDQKSLPSIREALFVLTVF